MRFLCFCGICILPITFLRVRDLCVFVTHMYGQAIDVMCDAETLRKAVMMHAKVCGFSRTSFLRFFVLAC